jgi:hypothetical protein
MEGLRTLVISQKMMSDSDYEDFKRRYSAAKSAMDNREAQI